MTTYAWPGWGVNQFELRLMPNLRTFVGPYTPTTQVLDFIGERWCGMMTLPPATTPSEIAAREAFWDRLRGNANTWTMSHQKLSLPNGTMRGSPTIKTAVTQFANTATITGALSGVNLLVNSSFEIDTNADGVADGWVAYGGGAVSGVSYSRVAGNGSAWAQRCFAASLGAGGGDQVGVARVLDAIVPNAVHTLSADFICNYTTCSVVFYIGWYTVGGTFISHSTATWVAPSSWDRKSITATAPATATQARCYAWMQGNGVALSNAQIYVDNVQLEVGTSASLWSGFPSAKAGDMVGLSGQLVRVLADATGNDAGDITLEFAPRARAAWSVGAPVVLSRPTAEFRLKTEDVPATAWRPGFAEAVSIEFIEAV